MIRMDKQAAMQEFGGRLAVASLGAVPKELGSSKVRIIHAHEVMINHRIRGWDRMRFPGVDDLEAMVRQTKQRTVLLKYDVSRAHKLVPVKEQDSLEKPEEVFMHTVGAFGFGLHVCWHLQALSPAIRGRWAPRGPRCGLLEEDPS